ncbi:DUF1062 domain-containing protein [Kitasatospora sp. NPDC028055]|uniref:DUF1062 domain-containing protein n=1 Tax=Kitasatospora sp. NPDC028055 TaxID=3155653 RepID=UPI0033FBDC8A
MNTDRKAHWAVRESALPTVVRPCPDCPGTRHRPSGKIRVNASGKLLDVWLLLSCAGCDRTSKVPVHERAHVSSLDPARLVAYETNAAAVVRELTTSASLAARNGYRLDWAGTWELEVRTPLHLLDDPTPLTVLVGFELPVPVRIERLLMLGLGLSRTAVRRMAADGRIQLPPALTPTAKAHRDFELTLQRPASVRAASVEVASVEVAGGEAAAPVPTVVPARIATATDLVRPRVSRTARRQPLVTRVAGA